MGEINSNLFQIDLESMQNNLDDEVFNDTANKVNIEEVYKNYSEILNSESKKLREKLSIEDSINEFNTIDISKSNFSKYQYDILKNESIALNIEDNVYNFLTLDNKIYKVSDQTLINIIMNTPKPKKIVYNLPCSTSSVYSMQLLANIMENIKSNSLIELLSSYGYKYEDYYKSLSILLTIFHVYEKLMYKYQYSSYIHFEHKIYNIFKNISFDIDESQYSNRIEECNNEISALCEKLGLSTIDTYKKLDFLNYIGKIDNDLIYPSLNIELLHSINLNDYTKLLELLSEKNFIESVINNNLFYDTYFNGGLKTVSPAIMKFTKKIIIRGSYQHLLQNMIAELLRNPEYIKLTNENKNMITEILLTKNIDYKDNIIILLEWALLAYINGCKSVEEYKLFFYTEKYTILSDGDIEYIVNILNDDLYELVTLIDDSCASIYSDNLIIHGTLSNFNKIILSTYRRLIKNLIIEVCDYANDFNNKNKSKINFIGFYQDTIYLECEEDSWPVAIDTLTRTLVNVYDKYLKKTKAHCLVENLSI
ncbi:hypothetical protein OD350_29120 (plasmid) [Clostridium beijerinckii]|uniref:hypothetical protein n=1 Tax=Clostridium beijerinckii TaxID=1520 RepID=UPI0022264401|nr:hypothetical protein [Clostridium beijerinckii]UYZ38951.1 hypothetical protein OD350_29120 [Clostridium beijerinckii]